MFKYQSHILYLSCFLEQSWSKISENKSYENIFIKPILILKTYGLKSKKKII